MSQRQPLGHHPFGGGVVGTADTKASWGEAGVAWFLYAEGIDRVADGPVVGWDQSVNQLFALELSHVGGIEVLPQQVVAPYPVIVHQDDGGVAALEEAAVALGNEAAGAASAHPGDPAVVQQELVSE